MEEENMPTGSKRPYEEESLSEEEVVLSKEVGVLPEEGEALLKEGLRPSLSLCTRTKKGSSFTMETIPD